MHASFEIHGPWGKMYTEAHVSDRTAYSHEIARHVDMLSRDERIEKIDCTLWSKWGGDIVTEDTLNQTVKAQ